MLKILERSISLQLLVFYGLFILPLLLGGAELYLFQRNALEQSTQRTDRGLAQAISLEIASNMRAANEEDSILSTSQVARQLNRSQLNSAFAAASLSLPDISLYFVCDTSGHLLLTYPASTQSQPNRPCDYIISAQALHVGTPYISSARVSPTTKATVITVMAPIENSQRHLIGLMGINVSVVQLTLQLVAMQRQMATDGESHIWLVDRPGTLLASTDHVPFQSSLRSILPSLLYVQRQEPASVIAQEKGRNWLYSYVPVAGTPWSVVLQRPTDVAFAALISFQNSLLIALIMLLVGASFFWLVLHGWVVSPLSKLALAVGMIRPDQGSNVADGALLARDRHRVDEIGRLISSFSVMEDEIHALFRKSDERSQRRLQTLDAIMRSMDEGVLLEHRDGHVIYANQSFTQFVGISPQELQLEDSTNNGLVEEKLLAIIENPDEYLSATTAVEEGKGSQTISFQTRGYYNRVGQFVAVRRDIRLRLFQVRALTGELIGRGKIYRDVTQQNEAEQIKKNLLAIVSHELRTPLTAMKGYATSLLATDVELDASLQEYFLRRIVEEGDRMAELVTSLLEMSQLEAGTLKLSPSLHRLDALIEHVVSQGEYQQMQVHLPADLPLLYVDGRRIELVLRNLLENARRYAGVDTLIEISANYESAQQRNSEGGLYLHISDTGPGLPTHLTERIFDRFYQVDGGMQRSTGGVGLGLAICRGFIEAHGGRIWAENRVGCVSGAIFHIWLPPRILYIPGSEPDTFALQNLL
jgi:signal transduction histidine kinase